MRMILGRFLMRFQMISSNAISTDVAENGKNVFEQGNPPNVTQELRLVNDDNWSQLAQIVVSRMNDINCGFISDWSCGPTPTDS